MEISLENASSQYITIVKYLELLTLTGFYAAYRIQSSAKFYAELVYTNKRKIGDRQRLFGDRLHLTHLN